MHQFIISFARWVQGTHLGVGILESTWAFPYVQLTHFTGLSLFIGTNLALDLRMMGIGKPVMVTESLECSRFPEDACARIASGLAEHDSLREHMRMFAGMPEVADAIGARAGKYIRNVHDAARVAGEYWKLLEKLSR